MKERIAAVRAQLDLAAAQIQYARDQMEIVRNSLNIINVALLRLESPEPIQELFTFARAEVHECGRKHLAGEPAHQTGGMIVCNGCKTAGGKWQGA